MGTNENRNCSRQMKNKSLLPSQSGYNGPLNLQV